MRKAPFSSPLRRHWTEPPVPCEGIGWITLLFHSNFPLYRPLFPLLPAEPNQLSDRTHGRPFDGNPYSKVCFVLSSRSLTFPPRIRRRSCSFQDVPARKHRPSIPPPRPDCCEPDSRRSRREKGAGIKTLRSSDETWNPASPTKATSTVSTLEWLATS